MNSRVRLRYVTNTTTNLSGKSVAVFRFDTGTLDTTANGSIRLRLWV